jgi:DNA-binding Lrp family transcriptional regulator
MTDIDKIDRKILSILQWDGRMANIELSRAQRPVASRDRRAPAGFG